MSRVLISVWFRIQPIIKKMSRVLFSVWFRIQRIIEVFIQNTTSVLFGVWFRIQGIIKKNSRVLFSVWFRIQRIKKCPGYYSASGSVFSVLLKNAQVIIQRLIQNLAYSRSQHCSRSWEAPRMSQSSLSVLNGAQEVGKSRESNIAQK